MTMVSIAKLDKNPHRDFSLYPIDKEQVKTLTDSMLRDSKDPDFWGGVTARAHPEKEGFYQIGAGHHRIAAAKKAGLKRVDIHVRDYDDAAMLDIMVAENATQMGYSAAAFADAVAAITRELAWILLGEEYLGLDSTVQTYFKTEPAFRSARGKLLKGEGIGRAVVMDRAKGLLSEREIKESLATLKASGKMGKILADVQAQVATELAEAEEEERLAQEEAEKEAARKKRKRKQAQKQKADEATEHTSQDEKLDAKVTRLFATTTQLTAWREAMMTEGSQHFFPVDGHVKMAKQMLKEIETETGRKHQTVTPASIKSWVRGKIAQATGAQRQMDAEQKRKYEREQAQHVLKGYLTNMSGSLRSIIGYTSKVATLLDKYPELNTEMNFTTVMQSLQNAEEAIKQLKEFHALRRGGK